MKRKLLQQFFNVVLTAVLAVAFTWLMPIAKAAFAQEGSPLIPVQEGQVPAPFQEGQMPESSHTPDLQIATTRLLSYQGRLLDPTTSVPKADGSYNMQFSLYTVNAGGAAVWTETKSVPVSKGLFTTLLGDTTPLTLALFNGQDLWLGVTVGADPEAAPRQRVVPTAYSLHADQADVALQANNANTLGGHSLSEFYRGFSGVQINQTSALAASSNHYYFTFGYSADQMVFWRVKPTTTGGKLKLDIETELGADGNLTYWLRVTNTGTVATTYQVIRYHFSQ